MAELTIERCDSRLPEGAIKALFARNDRPTFGRFYDRAYRQNVAAGGMHWIGLESGSVVMHLALFPATFRDGERSVRAGTLGDLMADVAHRNFWSPVRLVRQALADVRAGGATEFVYSDPTPVSVAVIKAAGLSAMGQLRRYVLPLNRLYLMVARLRGRIEPGRVAVERLRPFDAPPVAAAIARLGMSPGFRAVRTLDGYCRRVGGDVFGACESRVIQTRGETAALALVVPGGADRRLMVTDVLWDPARVSPHTVLLALGHDARREGCRALDLTTLEGSAFAEAAVRAGFIARQDTQPIVVLPMRDGLALPPVASWYLTLWDGSAW